MLNEMEERSKQFLKASKTLEKAGQVDASIILRFIVLRSQLFIYLERHNIEFDSTEDALFKAYKLLELTGIAKDLHSIFTIHTLIEYDPEFTIERQEFIYLSKKIDNIIELLTT